MSLLRGINLHFVQKLFLGLGIMGVVAALPAMLGSESGSGGTPDEARATEEEQQTPPGGQSTPHLPAVAEEGQLGSRPTTATRQHEAAQLGLHRLGLDSGRDGLLYVPSGYQVGKPIPLAVLLHGAGGNAQQAISLLQLLADANNLLLLAPQSRRSTWDVIGGDYGPDVRYIDAALEQTFSRYSVDPQRLAIGGFSDGASYALSLGLINGDLFTHIIAFSPGFMVPTMQEGKPSIYISHGTRDAVLPIDPCSRRIVPQLRRAGYDITYQEFDGPHTVPPDIQHEAVTWFTKS